MHDNCRVQLTSVYRPVFRRPCVLNQTRSYVATLEQAELTSIKNFSIVPTFNNDDDARLDVEMYFSERTEIRTQPLSAKVERVPRPTGPLLSGKIKKLCEIVKQVSFSTTKAKGNFVKPAKSRSIDNGEQFLNSVIAKGVTDRFNIQRNSKRLSEIIAKHGPTVRS